MATITLTGLRVRGHHGVLDHERTTGQVFLVDLQLEVDITRAAATDDVADTVNYAEVALAVQRIVAGEPVNLIETLVVTIAETVLAEFQPVNSVVATVHKPQAPIPADFQNVAITVTRHRAG